MKAKIITFGVAVILAAIGIFYFAVSKNSNQAAAPQTVQSSGSTPSSATTTFDVNDHLDQAIQDLNQVE